MCLGFCSANFSSNFIEFEIFQFAEENPQSTGAKHFRTNIDVDRTVVVFGFFFLVFIFLLATLTLSRAFVDLICLCAIRLQWVKLFHYIIFIRIECCESLLLNAYGPQLMLLLTLWCCTLVSDKRLPTIDWTFLANFCAF